MIPSRHTWQVMGVVVLGAAYLIMDYLVSMSAHPPLLAIVVSFLPLSALAWLAAWRSSARVALLSLLAACTVLLVLNLAYLRTHVIWLYFIQHAGMMSALGVMFGSTLMSGHGAALCSRIAACVSSDTLDAEYLRYTWMVTLAWTVYFALSALLSVLLFAFAPVAVWSLFANLLTPVLLGVMFVGEYLIRLRVLPQHSHFNILETVHAYRQYARHREHH